MPACACKTIEKKIKMSPLVLILLSVVLVNSVELPSSEPKETAREEKLRSALIDAFQNIKKGSSKGGLDDSDLTSSDLIDSTFHKATRNEKPGEFDLFTDDDGLTFADAFDNVEHERRSSSTENSHNVQHIVKTTKLVERTTPKPNKDKDGILSRLSDSIDSIRSTFNETRLVQRKEVANVSELLGIENMLRVFDAEILVGQWGEVQGVVRGQCREDLQEYVTGLLEKQLWALKSKLKHMILNIIKREDNVHISFVTFYKLSV